MGERVKIQGMKLPKVEKKYTKKELDGLKTQVVEDAKKVNFLLDGGALLALVIIILKILHQNGVSWQGITIPITGAWLIFLLLTIFHFYQGYLMLVNSAHDLWEADSLEHGKEAFRGMLQNGGIFVGRIKPRTRFLGNIPLPSYEMRYDVPSLVSYISVILLLLAIVPWDLSHLLWFFIFIAVALIIATANWLIAGTWIVAVSELGLKHQEATYHRKLEEKKDEAFESAFRPMLLLTGWESPNCGCVLLSVAILVILVAFILIQIFHLPL